jgi:hypothetical protein
MQLAYLASFLFGDNWSCSEKVTCSGDAGVPVLKGGPLADPVIASSTQSFARQFSSQDDLLLCVGSLRLTKPISCPRRCTWEEELEATSIGGPRNDLLLGCIGQL